MMRPTFEQVLEYLKNGEEDRLVEDMIKHDPEGAEKLRQAKLMLELLGRRSSAKNNDEDESIGDAPLLAGLASKSPAVAESVASYASYDDHIDHDVHKSSLKDIRSISDLTRNVAGSIENLGTLFIAAEDGRHTIRFVPSLPLMNKRRGEFDTSRKERDPRRGAMFMDFLSESGQPDTPLISGHGISISVEETPPGSDLLRLRLTETRRDVPARALEIIFMPENGPFMRISTNNDGLADLPVLDRPGILRFESDTRQTLQLEIIK